MNLVMPRDHITICLKTSWTLDFKSPQEHWSGGMSVLYTGKEYWHSTWCFGSSSIVYKRLPTQSLFHYYFSSPDVPYFSNCRANPGLPRAFLAQHLLWDNPGLSRLSHALPQSLCWEQYQWNDPGSIKSTLKTFKHWTCLGDWECMVKEGF